MAKSRRSAKTTEPAAPLPPLPPALIVEVVFAVPLPPFSYLAPPEVAAEIEVGALVEAPFGARLAVGCVVARRPAGDELAAANGTELRTIARRVSPGVTLGDEVRGLAAFVADYYCCSLGEALAAASPVGFNHQAAPRRSAMEGEDTAPRSPGPQLALTDEQQRALDRVLSALNAPRFECFLLHGVTGSGKTEIYLQAMAAALAAGRTALCLVPEIALTPQTVERFEARFGEPIGVLHSRQSRAQKRATLQSIMEGRVRLVIGPRSAVFAPLVNLGLIVVDEEHDGSYKQNETPRYHGRDVAITRAARLGIPIVLGSATPALESYHNALAGKYTLLRLAERVGGGTMPPVEMIDLGAELARSGRPSHFSHRLVEAMAARLARKEQSLLLLNRRGFSNFLFCPSCKWVARCTEDDVSLTVHRVGDLPKPKQKTSSKPLSKENAPTIDLFADIDEDENGGGPGEMTMARLAPEAMRLRCHFCGASHEPPPKCPECCEGRLTTVGLGTQRVEEELRALFPAANILRLDADTTQGRGAFAEMWEALARGDADILLGTQMIAKGLHLERVTLVGVVLADLGLFQPDFRAEERTFTLLTQAAGRSGRVTPGEVIFQTWLPHRPALRFARTHDYLGFFDDEMKRRRALGFPPASRLVAITVNDADRDRCYEVARRLANLLIRERSRLGLGMRDVLVTGPTVAPIARLAGRFRFRLLIRAATTKPMTALVRAAFAHREWKHPASTRVLVDVDAYDLV